MEENKNIDKKSLKFLCDGYVIGSPILFDNHLIKEKI